MLGVAQRKPSSSSSLPPPPSPPTPPPRAGARASAGRTPHTRPRRRGGVRHLTEHVDAAGRGSQAVTLTRRGAARLSLDDTSCGTRGARVKFIESASLWIFSLPPHVRKAGCRTPLMGAE